MIARSDEEEMRYQVMNRFYRLMREGRGIRYIFLFLAALGLAGSVAFGAESAVSPFQTQKVYYSVSVDRDNINLTLISHSQLPAVRQEILKNREGFILHLSHAVKLEKQGLTRSEPLMVLPMMDGSSFMILTSGLDAVTVVNVTENSVTLSIRANADAWAKYNGQTSQGLQSEAPVADSMSSRAVLRAHPLGQDLHSDQYVILRGRVITSARLGQLMQLPNMVPTLPLSTYINAVINPPGSDVVYLPGTTLTGGSSDHDIFLGYKVGPGSLRPYVSFMYEHDSNFFGTSQDPIAVDTYTLSPVLEYEIPGETRDFRISYNPVFRWYHNFNTPGHMSHFLNFDSRVEVSDRLRLALRDHLARGIIETNEFDPAHELNFANQPYWRNDIGAEIGFDLSEKDELIGDVDFNRVAFDQSFNPTYFNFDTYTYSLGWLRQQWATANFYLRYAYTKNLTSGTNAAGRGGNSQDYEFGINKQFTDRTSGNFTLGYRTTNYQNVTGSNFRSWTARASLSKQLSDRFTFDIAGNRTSAQSAFGTGIFANSFFVTNGVDAQLRRLGERIQLTFNGGYERNQYPELSLLTTVLPDGTTLTTVGPRRLDNYYTLGADVGVVLNSKMVLDFGYNFIDRVSNLGDPFSYYAHIFRVSLNFGRTSSGEGSQVYTPVVVPVNQQP